MNNRFTTPRRPLRSPRRTVSWKSQRTFLCHNDKFLWDKKARKHGWHGHNFVHDCIRLHLTLLQKSANIHSFNSFEYNIVTNKNWYCWVDLSPLVGVDSWKFIPHDFGRETLLWEQNRNKTNERSLPIVSFTPLTILFERLHQSFHLFVHLQDLFQHELSSSTRI